MEILSRLRAKGFASSNVVFGVGSFTYQMVTRDTAGFAVKATAGIVNGEVREIFKDPVTDKGTKKSARGFLKVEDGVLYDQQPNMDELGDMDVVFKDGELLREQTLSEIREILKCEKPEQ
jgi:nicotinamide phosphoribosyltransferase